jgi:hypothetical protein
MTEPAAFTGPVVTALVFSALSLTASLGALWWQVRMFFLSGGRVTVAMNLAELIPYAGVARMTTREDGKRCLTARASGPGGPGIELAQVVVQNPGRLAVTISKVELELVGGTEKDYSVTPRVFAVPGIDAASSDRTHLRLEPYGLATFLFDFWSVIERERKRGATGPIVIRARVRVAGKRRFYKSSRSTVWTFSPSDITSRDTPDRIAVSDVIMRELMRRAWRNDPDAKHAGRYPMDAAFAVRVGRQVKEEATRDEIQSMLEADRPWFVDPEDAGPMGMLSYEIHEYLERRRDRVDWAT